MLPDEIQSANGSFLSLLVVCFTRYIVELLAEEKNQNQVMARTPKIWGSGILKRKEKGRLVNGLRCDDMCFSLNVDVMLCK